MRILDPLPSYRVSVSGRKAENIYLKSLLKSGTLIIKEQISRMMTRYKSAKPNFYTAYLNATKVVNYGTRHEKPEDPAKPV